MLQAQPRVLDLIDNELVGWLTTVAPSGQPQNSAVWFIREGDDLLIYSNPAASRMTNLATNSRVAFNLRGDPQGDTIVTLEGTAEVDAKLVPPSQNAPYLAKYVEEMARLFSSPDVYDTEFSTPLRLTVTRLRHWG